MAESSITLRNIILRQTVAHLVELSRLAEVGLVAIAVVYIMDCVMTSSVCVQFVIGAGKTSRWRFIA